MENYNGGKEIFRKRFKMPETGEITISLKAWAAGDQAALDRLMHRCHILEAKGES